MAFAARNQAIENDLAAVRDGKAAGGKAGQSLLQQGSKRRLVSMAQRENRLVLTMPHASAPFRAPLGDMSNIAAPLNNRAQSGKEKVGGR